MINGHEKVFRMCSDSQPALKAILIPRVSSMVVQECIDVLQELVELKYLSSNRSLGTYVSRTTSEPMNSRKMSPRTGTKSKTILPDMNGVLTAIIGCGGTSTFYLERPVQSAKTVWQDKKHRTTS